MLQSASLNLWAVRPLEVDKARKSFRREGVVGPILILRGEAYVGGGITNRLIVASKTVRGYDKLALEDVSLTPNVFVHVDGRLHLRLRH